MDNDAERTMRSELAEALGEPVSGEEARAALERPIPTLTGWLREQQLLVAITAGAALVVGAILALALSSWWITAAALVVHGIVTVVVGYVVLRVTTEVEKPGPVTVARLESLGVDDPEARMNLAIQAHSGGGGADPVLEAFTTPAEERGSVADEQVSITPSSEETELTGPGPVRRPRGEPRYSRNGHTSPRG